MAEYLPVYKPGQALTLKASATIAGRQIVAVSGSGTVAPAGAGSTAFVGVAGFDAATNDNVTIFTGGVQEVAASGAITAGSPVICAADGAVSAVAEPATGQQVGVALTTAANGRVRVQFTR